MTKRAKPTTEVRETAWEHVSFGVDDKYGRDIGAWIYRSEKEGEVKLITKASRNGKPYGGGYQPPLYFETKANREAAVAKYLAAARKRAERTAQKREGGAA